MTPDLIADDGAPLRIVRGLPTSMFDLMYDAQAPYPEARLPPGQHAVPTLDGRTFLWDRPFDYGLILLMTPEEIDRAYRTRIGVGRRPALSLEAARRVKQWYWSGRATITELAKAERVARGTIRRVLQGRALWYA